MKIKLLIALILPIILLGYNKVGADETEREKNRSKKTAAFKAERIFDKACNGGDMKACFDLGELQKEKGYMVLSAKNSYSKACEGGEMLGCNGLGFLEEKEGNLTEAMKLYSRACDGGNKEGCSYLILLKEKKENISKTKKKEKSKEESSQDLGTQELPSFWSYGESTDKMRNEITKIAWVKSKNTVNFKFPYDGGSQLMLILNKTGKQKTQIYFEISKGQFYSSGYGRFCPDSKFDNHEVQRSFCLLSADSGKTNIMFLEDSGSFLKKIRKSKTLIIEFRFFDHGSEQFEFGLSGLQWN